MSGLVDKLLVVAVVLVAVGYAARALGPRRWRRKPAGKASGSCGGCDGCGSGSTASPGPGAAVSVPLSAIGHRQGASRPKPH